MQKVYLLIADIADSLCYNNFQDYGYAKRKLFHVKHLQFGGGYECYEFVSGVCAALLYFCGDCCRFIGNSSAQSIRFIFWPVGLPFL